MTAPIGPAPEGALAATLQRDRMVVVLALGFVALLSWIYLFGGAGMGDMMMRAVWTPAYAGLMFLMWWVMMIAMMLPSAAPTILLYMRMRRTGDGTSEDKHMAPFAPTAAFALAYITAWAGFSAGAVALQWALEASELISPMLTSTSAGLGGSLLVAAGLYQLTPLKQACLRYCRSPVEFLIGRWRNGTFGAFRMGLSHGQYCIGCCWFLMGLLFFGGVMNVYWILGLAILVLLEKTLPGAKRLSRILGVVLAVWGIAVLTGLA